MGLESLPASSRVHFDFSSTNREFSTKKLIIHAGTHKTGSAARQNYLATHPEHFGLHYLCSDNSNSSLLILQSFKEDLSAQPQFDQSGLGKADEVELCQSARTSLENLCNANEHSLSILSAVAVSTLTVPELETM